MQCSIALDCYEGLQMLHRMDIDEQLARAPRTQLTLSNANPIKANLPRETNNYGAPHYANENGPIRPALSRYEFKQHFYYGSTEIPMVLEALQFPRDPEREAQGLPSFPYRFEHGTATRWVTQEEALLVFLKRLRTRGSCIIHLENFFGRSMGYLSEVISSVLDFLASTWIKWKVEHLDTRVFDNHRFLDYSNCLKRHGLGLPGVCAFIDGCFHPINRPSASVEGQQIQEGFYSGAKKSHGLNFEIISGPDGLILRAAGPVPGRHHDVYLAEATKVRELFQENGPLHGLSLLGDKAYIGFGTDIIHPFIGAVPGSLEAFINEHISCYRIEVEHDIGGVIEQAGALQHPMNIDTQMPEVWFRAAVLFYNIHSCVYCGNQTAIRFNCPVMSLETYLSLL